MKSVERDEYDNSDDDEIVALYEEPPAKKLKVASDQIGQVPAKVEKEVERKNGMGGTSSGYFGKQGVASTSRAASAVSEEKKAVTSKAPNAFTISSTPRIALETYRLPRTAAPPIAQAGSAFGDCSTTLQTDPIAGPFQARPPRTEEQKRTHERWQAKVMGPGGLRPRRRSLALDEAAAAEARRMSGGGDVEEVDGTGTPAEQEAEDSEMKGSDDERQKAASGVGSKLAARFAVKDTAATTGKGKGKKKAEEVGPSGQTYTPLEKQFMEIKRENPDVLLLMEVGYKYK